ncbi:hypothetical protein PG993_005076 [Apiospora rasikravindrae]|uniref:Uncharacterized protein n=1 Tax=Apiospora rasikravindrae TaxID=990691 RepID=A0ABR1TF73_9PEZI
MANAAAAPRIPLPLELPARQAKVVQAAIDHWASNDSRLVSPQLAAQLRASVEVRGFPWDAFAKYALRLAVLCLVIAVFSALVEDAFARFWRRVREVPPGVRSMLTAAAGGLVHYYAFYRRQQHQQRVFANEAVHAVGALLFAVAALQLLDALDQVFKAHAGKEDNGNSGVADSGPWEKREEKTRSKSKKRPPPPPPHDEETRKAKEAESKARKQLRDRVCRAVILLLASIYGLVALSTGSNFIWSCAMVVLSYWFGAITGYLWGMYAIYMESPARFVGLGATLIGTSYLMRDGPPSTAALWSTTRIWGLLFLFVALWAQSLFYDWSTSRRDRLRHFLHFCAFFLAAGASVGHGLRYDDSTTKGFGLAFLGINLYTKFWEFCWGWYKPLFFAVLAGTFAMVGRFAEELWHMRALARLAG